MKIPFLSRLIVIMEQIITQRIIKMARTGVDGQTGGLIQDDDVLVLKDDVDGAGSGDDAAAPLRVGELDG